MSTAAVFEILVNDGKQDAMLLATDFLKNRLNLVKMKRARDPKIRDPTPTLRDVEETHVLFVNAHFRPFVTFAYEYHKTALNGSVNFGSSSILFSIEQFGEFFHDMVVNVSISSAVGVSTETNSGVKLAWAEYLGERLLRKVSFKVNGTELDFYTSESQNMYNKFMVTPNKQVGWDRLVGQEVPEFIRVANFTGVGGYQFTPPPVNTALYNRIDTIVRGLQTPKNVQPAFDLWIPLLFWFNLDSRISFPSIAVPYGQRFIELDLANLTDLLFVANLTAGENLHQFTPVNVSTDLTATGIPAITQMAIYTNNIFVHKDIHEIYLKRVGFNMVRVHREQIITVTANNAQFQLQQLKWPIEYMYVGLRPKFNLTHPYLWDKYHACLAADTADFMQLNPTVVGVGVGTTSVQMMGQTATVDNITLTLHNIIIYQNMKTIFFNAYLPFTRGAQHINTPYDQGAMLITFNLYTGSYQPSGYINISRAREFYLEYFSSVIGSSAGNGQNSFYLNGPTTGVVTGDLIVIGTAINFLLVSDGSAVLRYTT